MGRRKSPHGYKLSSLNALKHGLFTDGILPSRGPERCPFAAVCGVAGNQQPTDACSPGQECCVERDFFDAYVDDARDSFSFCLAWLSDTAFEETISQLAIVALQRQRLSALLAREGFTRPKVHPVSHYVYGVELSLGAGRYSASLDNRWNSLMERIVTPPDQT